MWWAGLSVRMCGEWPRDGKSMLMSSEDRSWRIAGHLGHRPLWTMNNALEVCVMYDLKMPKRNTEVQEMRNGSGNEVGSPPLSNIVLPIMNSVFN